MICHPHSRRSYGVKTVSFGERMRMSMGDPNFYQNAVLIRFTSMVRIFAVERRGGKMINDNIHPIDPTGFRIPTETEDAISETLKLCRISGEENK